MKKIVFLLVFVVIIYITIGYIFTEKKITSPIGFTSKSKSFTLIATGDIGLGRFVNYMIQTKNDPDFPFLNISSYLQDADLTVINLESPLINNCPIIVTGFKFCGKDTSVQGLVFAGVDAANLANNHTTNYGLSGLEETKNLLEYNNIAPFGLDNQITYKNVNGFKLALVGFVELGNNWGGLSNATDENVKSIISSAQMNSDVVIASFHWGEEYTHKPTLNQTRLAKLAIESGADIVIGNHAHWIQPIEKYNDKYIIYAQGNTVFDQDWSQKTREGVIYKFNYDGMRFNKIDTKYTIIDHNAQPRFATSEESSTIKDYLE